jgi:serine phosphatase RsbU (regulator of sigma subunit)/anti-sigma regulatory factor (Ser/Thr protein kinase)
VERSVVPTGTLLGTGGARAPSAIERRPRHAAPPHDWHDDAESVRLRLALLTRASEEIGTTLDLVRTAEELVTISIPEFADTTWVLLQERVATHHEIPQPQRDGSARVRRLALGVSEDDPLDPDFWLSTLPIGETVSCPPASPFARCMAERRSMFYPIVTDELAARTSADFDRPEFFRAMAGRSILLSPLLARGAVLGVLAFNRDPTLRAEYCGRDVELAEQLARRTALCIDNARLYNLERSHALTLQSSLLPKRVSTPPGMEVAHRYVPGSDVAEVGGDWFDVIPLPRGRVALIVGDVMGHGMQAATVMGQLRTAVRTLTRLDLPAVEVMAHLDALVPEMVDSYMFATCIIAVYDPETRTCEIVRAGHVPPVVVHPDPAVKPYVAIDVPSNRPLGLGFVTGPFDSWTLELPEGSLLVLCTDGLVESKDRDIDDGLSLLLDNLCDPDAPLEEICDEVTKALFHERDRDDLALLVARIGRAPSRSASWELPAESYAVREARHFVRQQVGSWGLDEATVETAELLVSELATNAVKHAAGPGPIEIRLSYDDRLTCEVADQATAEPTAAPTLPDPDDLDENGRGLFLVGMLSSEWGSRRTSTGKVVWFALNSMLKLAVA